MTHQRISEGLCSCLVLVCAMCEPQSSQAWAQNMPQQPRVRTTRTTYVDLELPTAIQVDSVRRYGDILALTDAQMDSMRQAHEKYRQAYRKLTHEAIAPLWEQSAQVANISSRSLEAAVSYEALIRDRKGVLRRIARLDDLFFDEVFLQLAEDQMALMDYVRLDRAREVYGFVFNTADLPEAKCDLVELLLELRLPEEDKGAAIALSYEYLQAAVPILKRRAKTLISARVKDKHLLSTLSALDGDDLEQRIKAEAAVLEARRQLFWQPLNLSRSMRRVNLRFLPLFMAALPDEAAARFLGRFNAKSYPKIYPDPSIAEPAILTVLSLDCVWLPDQRDAIEAAAATYRQSYQRVCKEMEERITEWREILALHGALHVDDMKDHEDAMEELRLKRTSLNRKVITTITAMLTPEQIETFPPVRTLPG